VQLHWTMLATVAYEQESAVAQGAAGGYSSGQPFSSSAVTIQIQAISALQWQVRRS